MNTTHIYRQPVFKTCTAPWFSSSSRMLCFLLVSLALHGLLIAVFPKYEPSTAGGWHEMQQPIQLTLNTAAANNRKTRQPPAAVHPAATHQSSRHAPPASSHPASNMHSHPLKGQTQTHPSLQQAAKTSSHHATSTREQGTAKAAIASTAQQSEPSMSTPSPDPAAVAVLLRHALQQHFYYPLIALQNSWEGKVVLGVRVSADGKVGNARVLEPSGFRILDRAAQHAANKIGRLPAAPPLLAGQALTFRVPVAYRLRR